MALSSPAFEERSSEKDWGEKREERGEERGEDKGEDKGEQEEKNVKTIVRVPASILAILERGHVLLQTSLEGDLPHYSMNHLNHRAALAVGDGIKNFVYLLGVTDWHLDRMR